MNPMIASVCVLGIFSVCHAATDADGFEWVVVGDPGNRPVTEAEAPFFWPPHGGEKPLLAGSVAYPYRMSVFEVTNEQWLEFVNAYAPYNEGFFASFSFTGFYIFYDSQAGVYRMDTGTDRWPAEMSWRYAARYCNWLHNNKAPERWAFESGVYDTATFGEAPDGSFTDQITRSPGSRYWIPSLDEWVKAVHWDPDKDGEGGYWLYPYGSDAPPSPGPPGNGDTSAGYDDDNFGFFWDAGSYPHARTPWGLLDASGGVREKLEFPSGPPGSPTSRLSDSSDHGDGDPASFVSNDRLDRVGGGRVTSPNAGLRLARSMRFLADLDTPWEVLDLRDIVAFINAYLNNSSLADFADPPGVIDDADVGAYVEAFFTQAE